MSSYGLPEQLLEGGTFLLGAFKPGLKQSCPSTRGRAGPGRAAPGRLQAGWHTFLLLCCLPHAAGAAVVQTLHGYRALRCWLNEELNTAAGNLRAPANRTELERGKAESGCVLFDLTDPEGGLWSHWGQLGVLLLRGQRVLTSKRQSSSGDWSFNPENKAGLSIWWFGLRQRRL